MRPILLQYILSVLLLLTGYTAAAQSPFTQFDWQAMRIDSILPTYNEVVPLQTDGRLYDYDVRVTYPEWKALTTAESLVADRYAYLLADTLRIRTFVGMSRRQSFMDISFVPVVRRGNGYAKLLSCKLEIVPKAKAGAPGSRKRVAATRAAADRYAAASVLAEGRWVRVSLTDDGIYRLTNSSLRSQMGFTNTANIHVYGYGGHMLPEMLTGDEWDDLEEVPLLPVADGYLFFANGLTSTDEGRHVINHYARSAYYFITQTDTPAATIATLEPPTATPTAEVCDFDAVAYHNPQEFAWFSGGRQLFENYNYANGNTRTYVMKLPTHAATAEGTLTVAFSAANKSETELSTIANGQQQTTARISRLADYTYAMLTTRRFAIDVLPSNTIQLSTTRGNNARLNYLELAYKGLMRLDADIPQIHFSLTADEAATMTLEYAAGQKPQIWRLGEPGVPAARLTATEADITGADGSVRHVLRAAIEGDGATHRYVAFDANVADRYPTVEYAGTIDNQNLHAQEAADMVIITPASGIFDAEAERLAEEHRQLDGLKVAVVRADKIYNEFSSGTPDATAYRRFLKMLYDRADDIDDAPRYLLLFGDCAWDNRMLTAAWMTYDPDNFLLAFESENSVSDTKCYVMEDYFGLLDDGEGASLVNDKTDIGVGRFPVRTLTEARTLVDKTVSYMRSEHVGAWKNVVAVLGDDGTANEDGNIHMEYADSIARVITRLHPEVEVRKTMWDAFVREATTTGYRYPQVTQALKEQIQEGALMFNYTGHAATYCLSHEQVLRIEDFASISAPRAALWVTAACDVMPFDTQTDNIGETAILNKNGLAVAFFGTARTVYANNNLQINREFCKDVFGTDSNGRPNRIGDAVRDTKVRLITANMEAGNLENKLHYALLGDPALRLGSVENRIVIDSIAGIHIDAIPDDFTLHAGQRVRFAGHIANAEGTLMSDFNGTITGRLYDSESSVTCRNNDRLPEPFRFKAYDKLLYTGADSVADGRFAFTCPMPIDIKYSDEAGRLVCFAVSNDLRTEANGYCEDFAVGGTQPDLSDTTGPQITAYLNSDTFADGDKVGATPYFVALLADESGINYSGNGLGHDLELIIDNNPATTYILNDYYTGSFGDYSRGSVAFSIPQLDEGDHTLTFRAWDMLNNYSTTSLNFIVDPTIQTGIISLTATQSPATTQTQFLLHYDRPGSPCEFTIEVFDFSGRLLWTHTEQGSSSNGLYAITWNLTTGGGMPLGSGIYLYRARISCDSAKEATKAQKIVINRRK